MALWEDAADILSTGLNTSGSDESVTIQRDGLTNELEGTFGKSEFEVIDKAGMALEYTTEDFLCNVDDYTFTSPNDRPARGDRLTRILPSGETVTYEVQQPDGTTRPYRLSCQDLRMRVHLKRVPS